MGRLHVIEAKGTERLKRGFARMVKGGVIMDVFFWAPFYWPLWILLKLFVFAVLAPPL